MTDLDYSRSYLRWHSDSDEHFERQSTAEYSWLKRHLPDDKAADILEFGCGRGFALAGVARAGYSNVEGIDSNSGQIEAGLKRDLNVKRVDVEETMEFFEACAGKYDFIYSIDVIEHIPVDKTIEVLRAIRLCLKPGGKFLCRVPNSDHILASHLRYIDQTHQTMFSDVSLDFVLHNAGFVEISVFPTRDGCPRIRPRNLNNLINWGLRRIIRAVHFAILRADFGIVDAKRTSLTPNILAVGYKPK